MARPSFDPETLLAYDGFVRGLAKELLDDAHGADDAAQETWIAALGLGPGGVSSLPTWLARVVRNLAAKSRRSSARRAEREQAAARAEAVPSVAEILEREEARRRVVEAVVALDEPYRSTLLLRYFENLAPGAIAKRQAVPVETVRTRIRRGLEQLRARLDREYGGDRGAWCGLIVPLAELPPVVPISTDPSAVPRLLSEVLAMSIQAKIAGVAAAALVAFVAFLALRDRGGEVASPSPEGADPTVLAHVPSEPAPSAELRAPEALEARAPEAPLEAASPPPVQEPFGSLHVRVTWAADKTPAAGIGARVERLSIASSSFHAFPAVTGPDGTFRIARIHAGRVRVVLDREPFTSATVITGEEAELEIEIPRGFDIEGVVVTSGGLPVAKAEVWLSDAAMHYGGFVVARTGSDGSFRARSLQDAFYGARAAGHAPSLLQQLSPAEGSTSSVRFVLLGAGGEVKGTVLDPADRPVAGALVLVGRNPDFAARKLVVESEEEVAGILGGPLATRTDEEGHYLARGIAPGATPVAVRAEGYAIWRGEVEVLEHAGSTLDAHLFEGVELSGTVSDGDGRPLEGVEVRVGREYGWLATNAISSTEGSFHFDDVEPGTIQVRADGEERGSAVRTFTAAAGEALVWDAVLSTGMELAGRVVDEHGEPLAGWSIVVEDEGPVEGIYDHLNASTDTDGRFVVENCHDTPHRVEARAPEWSFFPCATATGVFPGRGELVLRVDSARRPSARIVGSVLDEAGGAVGGVQIIVSNGDGGAPILNPGPDGRRFELGPYPPGTFTLFIRAQGLPDVIVGPKELQSGETWDCGTLVLVPGGTLVVRTRESESAEGLVPDFSVHQGTVRLWNEMTRSGDAWRSDALPPGEFRLAVEGEGVAHWFVPFAIRSGETTTLEVALEPGAQRAVRVSAPDGAGRLQPLLSIASEGGAVVVERHLWLRQDGSYGLEIWLAPGSYRVEVREPGGLHAEGALIIGDLAEAIEPLELELR